VVVKQTCRLISAESIKFTVVHDHVESYPDINKELARYFSCTGTGMSRPDTVSIADTQQCFMQLKWVLIMLLIIGATVVTVIASITAFCYNLLTHK